MRSLWILGLLGFFATFILTIVFLYSVLIEPLEPRPLTIKELLVQGNPSDAHKEFIDRIKRDLKIKDEVKIILGPPFYPLGELARQENSWAILSQENFFNSLTDIEQKALIGHELGHVLYSPPKCLRVIECQKSADKFAAAYTSPKAVIDLLNSFSNDPRWLGSEEYKQRIESLKKLQGQ